MNVNTTKQTQSDADIERAMKKQEVEMQRIFADSPRFDIFIPARENSKDQTIEGGMNGHFWKLRRGVHIQNVPQPICDQLDESGIQYTHGLAKPSPAMLEKQRKAEADAAEADAQAKADADKAAKDEQKRLDKERKEREKAEADAKKKAGDKPPA